VTEPNEDSVVLRAMTAADVPSVLDVQEPGAVRGLAEVFPQDAYPFPREDVERRWLQEIEMPDVECHVVLLDDVVAGFVATRGAELLHFGVAVEHWGTGLAPAAHDAVLDRMQGQGIRRAWLRVFTGNLRGRRFYERLGWRPTGDRTRSTFPPHPELLRYERPVVRPAP
jgi:RimJ/RimL family protein N-acetyltransferase